MKISHINNRHSYQYHISEKTISTYTKPERFYMLRTLFKKKCLQDKRLDKAKESM